MYEALKFLIPSVVVAAAGNQNDNNGNATY